MRYLGLALVLLSCSFLVPTSEGQEKDDRFVTFHKQMMEQKFGGMARSLTVLAPDAPAISQREREKAASELVESKESYDYHVRMAYYHSNIR